MRSSANTSEGGSSVAEKIKKTLDLLDLSGSKNIYVKKDDDTSSYRSSPLTPHEVSQSNNNLFDNLCYSPTSPTIMHAIVTNASSMEETLANLTKVIDGLAKHMQNQDALIDKKLKSSNPSIFKLKSSNQPTLQIEGQGHYICKLKFQNYHVYKLKS
ncbi:hypothetical protein RND71_004081 [Anisodus tanguticus]|uniref:Uncharacterized protein n=1 Tax=Anisodus tanguticus TaxID=243964 RepID=A0AAE1VXG7_9SOLA|nr:hypothetical protein RND71_004081 [Anisodus tanguticus]